MRKIVYDNSASDSHTFEAFRDRMQGIRAELQEQNYNLREMSSQLWSIGEVFVDYVLKNGRASVTLIGEEEDIARVHKEHFT